MRFWVLRSTLLLSLFAATLTLKAQDSGSMTGNVTDASGALVSGASVTLLNPQTGVKLTTKTDSHGSYHFAVVPPAPGYTETVAFAGFSTEVIKDLKISVGDTRTQNVKLTAGAVTEVTVSARQEESLNTTDATIGNNIDVEQLNELPVYDRTNGISTLFYLQPGVDSAAAQSRARASISLL